MSWFNWFLSLFKREEKIVPIENIAPVDLNPKTPWLSVALSYLGRKEEISGAWVVSLFKNTSFGVASSPKVPWCAAFVCTVLAESGYQHSRSAAAMSFALVGHECIPVPGAIMVWRHKFGSLAGRCHVNIMLTRIDATSFMCVGGNQAMNGSGGAVTIAKYSLSEYDLVSSRMPIAKS